MSQQRNYRKERARVSGGKVSVKAIDDVYAVASLTTDDVARRHRRTLDFELLNEFSKYTIPEGVRRYVDKSLAWLQDTDGAVLGGRQRDVFEMHMRRLRLGLGVADRVVGQAKGRYITTRSTLTKDRGREEKRQERASMTTNTPWMADPKLLPMRPPGKS